NFQHFKLKIWHTTNLVAVSICYFVLGQSVTSFNLDIKSLYNYTVHLLPDRNLIAGSRLTISCAVNSDAGLSWLPLIYVRRLNPEALFNATIALDGRSAFVVIDNVSVAEHNGSNYDCVGQVRTNASLYKELSLHKELLVGYKPAMPDFKFYWLDRKAFTSVAEPPLAEVQRRAGLPPPDGRLTLRVWYRDLFTGPEGRNCTKTTTATIDISGHKSSTPVCNDSCACNSLGNCDWGNKCQTGLEDDMEVFAELCNNIGWCTNATWKFDRRDKEKPLPVGGLRANFQSNSRLVVSWESPTVTTSDQNYTYRVDILTSAQQLVATQISNHTSLAFNNTYSLLRHGEQFNIRAVCQPRYYAGYDSDPIVESFVSPESAPCAPPALVLTAPSENSIGAALPPLHCRNGRIRQFVVSDTGWGRNSSVTVGKQVEFVAWQPERHQLVAGFEKLRVAAATSVGVGPPAVGAVEIAWLQDCALQPQSSSSPAPADELLDITDRLGSRRVFVWSGSSADRPEIVACEKSALSGDSLAECQRVWLLNGTLLASSDGLPVDTVGTNLTVRLARYGAGRPACLCHLVDGGSTMQPEISVIEEKNSLLTLAETSCRGHLHIESYWIRPVGGGSNSSIRCSRDRALPRRIHCRLPPLSDSFNYGTSGRAGIVEARSGRHLIFRSQKRWRSNSSMEWSMTIWLICIGLAMPLLKNSQRQAASSNPVTDDTRLTPSAGSATQNGHVDHCSPIYTAGYSPRTPLQSPTASHENLQHSV
uniref:Fibronectin type-III domain-containing protein n=1 Tax=Macrostomum lignano TaxID=282301 RepID=A0A1I8J4V3_9PLAT